MHMLTRRRFIAISAAGAGLAALPARATGLYDWRGQALGAEARILIDHPDAEAITTRAAAEIARLEAIFSLYKADSALARLNQDGILTAPPFELLQCLALSGQIHAASNGLFDPSIQPLWALYASRFAAGTAPTAEDLRKTQTQVGWQNVTFDEEAIRLAPGMALTLNGIAQGFIADRIADQLRAEGLDNILVNTGEFHALGSMPDGAAWPVQLTTGGDVPLVNRALASSAALGTTFDQAGKVGHILNPRTGTPAPATWQLVSISAPQAALADALSTTACLLGDKAAVQALIGKFDQAKIETLA